ncbi:unnamed protein product [Calypogeia fissa]
MIWNSGQLLRCRRPETSLRLNGGMLTNYRCFEPKAFQYILACPLQLIRRASLERRGRSFKGTMGKVERKLRSTELELSQCGMLE